MGATEDPQVSDGVAYQLTPDSPAVVGNEQVVGQDGVKGPDETQWGQDVQRDEPLHVPADGEGEYKGPSRGEWGQEARKGRGASLVSAEEAMNLVETEDQA